MKFISWVLAWVVMFILIYAMAKTRAGNVIIYYVSWLLVFLLVVTHATQLINLLQEGGF